MGRRTGVRPGRRGASPVTCGDAPVLAPPAPRAAGTPPSNSGAGAAHGDPGGTSVRSTAPPPLTYHEHETLRGSLLATIIARVHATGIRRPMTARHRRGSAPRERSVLINLYQNPAVIARSPFRESIEGARPDALVKPTGREYVIELAGSRFWALFHRMVCRYILRVRRFVESLGCYGRHPTCWVLGTDQFETDGLHPLEYAVASFIYGLWVAVRCLVDDVEIAGDQ